MSWPLRHIDVVATAERAAAIVDPVRQRLLAELRDEPESAAGLARRLGAPRQRLNFHLRELEKAGFVRRVAERRKRNCTERLFRATARQYLIDPAVLGVPGEARELAQDRFSAEFVLQLAARTVREVGALGSGATQTRKRLATAGIDTEIRVSSPAAWAEFVRDLTESIAGAVARHHDERSPQGRRLRVTAASYPVPKSAADPSKEVP